MMKSDAKCVMPITRPRIRSCTGWEGGRFSLLAEVKLQERRSLARESLWIRTRAVCSEMTSLGVDARELDVPLACCRAQRVSAAAGANELRKLLELRHIRQNASPHAPGLAELTEVEMD